MNLQNPHDGLWPHRVTSRSSALAVLRSIDRDFAERYVVIAALCARFVLVHNIKSGSVDFTEFVAMLGKSVDTVLVEMQMQKAAAMPASGALP
jgi:hypothetical protein